MAQGRGPRASKIINQSSTQAGSLVYTFTVPYAAIQLTLYYFDLAARGVGEAWAGVNTRFGPSRSLAARGD